MSKGIFVKFDFLTKWIAVFKKSTLFKHALGWLIIFIATLMLSAIYCISAAMKQTAFGPNMISIYPKELILPLALSTMTALVVSGVFYIVHRNQRIAALISSLTLIAVISDYQSRFLASKPLITGIYNLLPFPTVGPWATNLIFLAILFTGCAILSTIISKKIIVKYFAKYTHKIFQFIIFVVLIIFILNVLNLVGYLIDTNSQIAYRPASLPSPISSASDKPDIYYIVLDRYTNNDNLKNYFSYDDQFISRLRSSGYYVDESGHSNYPYTAMSIGSTLSANYLNNLESKYDKSKYQSEVALFNLSRYSPVAKTFKELGYEYDVIGSWYNVSNKAPLANHQYNENSVLKISHTKSKILSSFENIQLQNSIFFEFLKSANRYNYQDPVAQAQYQLNVLNNMADKGAGGKLIFAHILVPHDPYVFNSDGSISGVDQGNNNNGKLLKNKYVDQVKYIGSEVGKLSDKIINNTKGKAVIILQSDEGPWPQYVIDDENGDVASNSIANENMTNWSDDSLQTKYGVLAAYHIPDATTTELAKGANSVNIFRLILNKYFNYNLDYLPVCSFGLNEGRSRSFNYTNITSRLTGSEDPKCKTIHD
ncbi:MAG: hypothetical protein M0R39_17325 [Prolixibacteraceae bacterium]|nr:hypothetical protein [Prolixibacteraceae bacterium]